MYFISFANDLQPSSNTQNQENEINSVIKDTLVSKRKMTRKSVEVTQEMIPVRTKNQMIDSGLDVDGDQGLTSCDLNTTLNSSFLSRLRSGMKRREETMTAASSNKQVINTPVTKNAVSVVSDTVSMQIDLVFAEPTVSSQLNSGKKRKNPPEPTITPTMSEKRISRRQKKNRKKFRLFIMVRAKRYYFVISTNTDH